MREAKIFAKGLPPDIKEKEVRYIFSKYGTLVNADIIMWPAAPTLCPNGCLAPVELNLSGRRERPDWQACAFITYSSSDAATTAIRALNNVYKVRGGSSSEPISVCVARSGALPEPVQAATGTATAAPAPTRGSSAERPASADKAAFSAAPASATASYVAEKTRCKLFVGNLFANLPKEALTNVFSEFGRVVNVHIMTGKSKFGSACAFVEMSNPQEAEVALRAMHQKYELRIGSGTAPITVTYFQSQSSGKAGQSVAGTGSGPQRSRAGSDNHCFATLATCDCCSMAEEQEVCAICMDRPAGARLQPCGHSNFCHVCVKRLSKCPLCQQPLTLQDNLSGQPLVATPAFAEAPAAQNRSVISKGELTLLRLVCFGFWLFVFIGGIIEHLHDLPQSCKAGDPVTGTGAPDWLSVPSNFHACDECSPRNKVDCDYCAEGLFNLGMTCYKYLENMPALKTGAALGGTTYFALIILTQVTGILTEVGLIRRLLKRRLMPRKELVILTFAILIEVVRMLLVDVAVMQEYFGGRSYQIFREPLTCSAGDPNSWQGSDGIWYCPDLVAHTSDTRYYVASHQGAWDADANVCSTFTTESALLKFDEVGHQEISGHTRFKTMGWVVGGEFALYYLFATFINELADNMFVVPSTTAGGWLCKIFSIALEVFQLGALCPAAVFRHRDCLHYTAPLGVSLGAISLTIVTFGYFIWSFVLVSIPLALASFTVLQLAICLSRGAGPVGRAIQRCARQNVFSRCPRGRACLESLGRLVEGSEEALRRLSAALDRYVKKGGMACLNATMLLAFIPMLCGGLFLGVLVVVGQVSKSGFVQALTAIVLLSDVLFKVVATAVTELADYLLHRRVQRNMEVVKNRPNRASQPPEVVIGQSAASSSSSSAGPAKGNAQ